MIIMACAECRDLAKIYVEYLDEYVDLLESRKLVNRVWPELQARTRTAEVNLTESWYWLPRASQRASHCALLIVAGAKSAADRPSTEPKVPRHWLGSSVTEVYS